MPDFAECSGNFLSLTPAQICEGFTNCEGGGISLTSAGFNAVVRYLEDMAAGGPDVFLSGLQSYDAVTNTLTLLMSDGSTVAVDMTDLIADAVGSIPNDTVTSNAASNTLLRGLHAGIVDKPDGSAAALADVQGATPSLSVAYASMRALMTNAGAEANADAGVMNVDGSLGYRSNIAFTLAQAMQNNGQTVRFQVNTQEPLGTTLPAPAYNGQVINIFCEASIGNFPSPDTATYAFPLAPGVLISGALRTATNQIRFHTGGGHIVRLRGGDSLQLVGLIVGTVKVWFVLKSHYVKLQGNNWVEDDAGMITIHGNSPYNPAAFPAWTTPPSVIHDDGSTFIAKGARL